MVWISVRKSLSYDVYKVVVRLGNECNTKNRALRLRQTHKAFHGDVTFPLDLLSVPQCPMHDRHLNTFLFFFGRMIKALHQVALRCPLCNDLHFSQSHNTRNARAPKVMKFISLFAKNLLIFTSKSCPTVTSLCCMANKTVVNQRLMRIHWLVADVKGACVTRSDGEKLDLNRKALEMDPR